MEAGGNSGASATRAARQGQPSAEGMGRGSRRPRNGGFELTYSIHHWILVGLRTRLDFAVSCGHEITPSPLHVDCWRTATAAFGWGHRLLPPEAKVERPELGHSLELSCGRGRLPVHNFDITSWVVVQLRVVKLDQLRATLDGLGVAIDFDVPVEPSSWTSDLPAEASHQWVDVRENRAA